MSFLNPKLGIDFSAYIVDRTLNFIGRKWVFEAIQKWLADTKGDRFFLLTGEPGSGKTAIASRLAQFSQGIETFLGLEPGFLHAVHFCSARDSLWTSPLEFARNIAMQLAQGIPEFALALKDIGEKTINIYADITVETAENSTIQAVVVKNLTITGLSGQDAFDQVVVNPLRQIRQEGFSHPVTILVDSLDEALTHDSNIQNTIVNLLAKLSTDSNIRLLLTSRNERKVKDELITYEELFLSAPEHLEQNKQDIRGYIDQQFRQKEALRLQAEAGDRPYLITTLTDKSEGNFLYIRFLLNAVVSGKQSLTNPEGLPQGLDELYYFSLRRVVKLGGKDWLKFYAPVMGVLLVAQESLKLSQVQAITQLEKTTVLNCLTDLQQFIDPIPSEGEETLYRLYHQSVTDFLGQQQLIIQREKSDNLFYLSTEEQHQKVIHYYLGELDVFKIINYNNLDEYGLQHISKHLYDLKHLKHHREALYSLMNKTFMEEKHAKLHSHQSFLSDVVLAIEAAHEETPSNLVQQVRGCLIYTSIVSQADKIPQAIYPTLTYLNKIDQAIEIASLLALDKSRQCKTYQLIAQTLLERKETRKAIQVLRQALDIANTLQEKWIRNEIQILLVKAFLSIKDLDSALQTINQIEEDWLKKREIEKVVQAAIDIEKFDMALTAAESIESVQSKAEALVQIFQVTIKTEQGELVHQVLNLSLQAINQIGNDWQKKKVIEKAIQSALDAEKFDVALTVAESIESVQFKAEALVQIFQVTIKTEQGELVHRVLNLSLQAINQIGNDWQKKKVIEKAIQSALDAEKFDVALTVAESIESVQSKAEALVQIFQATIKTEQGESVHRVLNLVLQAINQIEEDWQKKEVIEKAIQSALDAEKFDMALTVAESIESVQSKAEALVQIFQVTIKTEQGELVHRPLNLALQKINQIEEDWQKKQVIEKVIQAALDVEKFDMALTAAESIESVQSKAEALVQIFQVTNKTGEADLTLQVIDLTLQSINQIEGGWQKEKVIEKIIQAAIDVGKFKVALAAAELIESEYSKAEALTEIAQAAAKAGEVELALQTINQIEDNWLKEQAVNKTVQAAIDVGKFEVALAAAELIESEYSKAEALTEIAQAAAKAGEVELALQTINQIEGNWRKEQAVNKTVQTAIDAEKFEVALALVNSSSEVVKMNSIREPLLRRICQALDQRNRFDQALSIVDLIETPEEKSLALGHISQSLAELGHTVRALEIANQTLEALTNCNSQSGKISILALIIKTLILSEEKAQAKTLADEVKAIFSNLNERSKQVSRKEFIQILSWVEEFDQAITLIEKMENLIDIAECLRIVAGILVQANYVDHIERLIEAASQVSKVSQEIKDSSQKASIVTEIAESLILAGQNDLALVTIETIPNSSKTEKISNRLLHSLLQTGNLEHTRRLVDYIDDSSVFEKARCWVQISDAFAQRGKCEEVIELTNKALEIVKGSYSTDAKRIIVNDSAKALASVGQLKLMLQVINLLQAENTRQTTLSDVTQFLIQVEEFERAAEVLKLIEDANVRKELQQQLSLELVKAEKFNEALEIAIMITEQSERVNLITQLLNNCLNLGLFDQAAAVAKRILSEQDWHKIIQKLTSKLLEEDRYEDVITVVVQLDDSKVRDGLLHKAADKLTQAQSIEKALAAIKAISDEHERVEVLNQSLQKWSDSLLFNQAIVFVKSIFSLDESSNALVKISHILIGTNKWLKAAMVAMLLDESYKRSTLIKLAVDGLSLEITLTELDMQTLTEVFATAKLISDDYDRIDTLACLLRAISSSTNFKQILKYFKTNFKRNEWEKAFIKTGEELIEIESFDSAFSIVEEMRDRYSRTNLLTKIAQKQSQAQNLDKALKIIDGFEKQYEKDNALVEIVSTLVELRAIDSAMEVIQKISEVDRRVDALSKIALILAQSEDLAEQQRANALVNQILGLLKEGKQKLQKASLLREFARVFLNKKQFDQALQIARTIPCQNWYKSNVLSWIASDLNQALDWRRAIEVADEMIEAIQSLQDLDTRAWRIAWATQLMIKIKRDRGLKQLLRIIKTSNEEHYYKAKALSRIAHVLALESKKIKANASSPWLSKNSLNRIVRFLSQLVYFFAKWCKQQRAAKIAYQAWGLLSPDDKEYRSEILSKIALALTRSGKKWQARKAANQALFALAGLDGKQTATVLAWIAVCLFDAGSKQKAKDVLDQGLSFVESLSQYRAKNDALMDLAEGLAFAGSNTQIERALMLIEATEEVQDKARFLVKITRFAAESKNWDLAQAKARQLVIIASSIQEQSEKADTLEQAIEAITFVRNRDLFDQALSLVETLDEQEQRARIIAKSAETLAEAKAWVTEEVVSKAVQLIESLKEERRKPEMLLHVIKALTQTNQQAKALEVLGDLLTVNYVSGYDYVLRVLENGATTLGLLENGQILWEIHQTILEIQGWWDTNNPLINPDSSSI